MLLRFSISNHHSIRSRQELSLAASSLKDVETGLIDTGSVQKERVLPATVIYGPNASGKSNFLAGLGFLRSAVLYSHSRGEPGAGVPRNPFALDPACNDAPTVVDVDFVVDGERYHYGFEAFEEFFGSEWLYSFPSNRRRLLFERERKNFEFGRGLKGRNRVIADLTRPNSLFLSAAVQNDHEQLSKVTKFFRTMHSDFAISAQGASVSSRFSEIDIDPRIVDFLKRIGTGIVDSQRREIEVPEEVRKLTSLIDSAFRNLNIKDVKVEVDNKDKQILIELGHMGHDGRTVFFDLDRESTGTRRLLNILSKLFPALDEGALVVIDELDASLHTQACEAVLALFCSTVTNPRGAQLVTTTHDTNLLRSPVLRRDQIWFTEKDDEGATDLYPLSDIRSRKGDNIEKGYLEGRYGAMPFAGPISDLFAVN